jgi:uncharacterized protein
MSMTGPEVQKAGKTTGRLAGVEAAAARQRGPAPVERWNPPFLGDLDMRIAADGTWFYMGSPITRARMVRLFSSVLRRDEDGRTYLVTPAERFAITVDDAPFLAVRMAVSGAGREQSVSFETNVDDEVTVDEAHPLRFERQVDGDGLKPYVLVRGRLEALVNRPIFYDLVEKGTVEQRDGEDWYGVWSSSRFWPMARAAEIGLRRA